MTPGAMNPGLHLGMGVAAGAAASNNPGMPSMNHSMQAVSTIASCKHTATAPLQSCAVRLPPAADMLPGCGHFAISAASS